jgi:hypothetical protein
MESVMFTNTGYVRTYLVSIAFSENRCGLRRPGARTSRASEAVDLVAGVDQRHLQR